jgi:signal transduction histidine kinase
MVRISIGDGGPTPSGPAGRRRDPRRGHGLRIVGRIARDHGGRFLFDRSPSGTEAVLELPAMADGARPGAREPAA